MGACVRWGRSRRRAGRSASARQVDPGVAGLGDALGRSTRRLPLLHASRGCHELVHIGARSGLIRPSRRLRAANHRKRPIQAGSSRSRRLEVEAPDASRRRASAVSGVGARPPRHSSAGAWRRFLCGSPAGCRRLANRGGDLDQARSPSARGVARPIRARRRSQLRAPKSSSLLPRSPRHRVPTVRPQAWVVTPPPGSTGRRFARPDPSGGARCARRQAAGGRSRAPSAARSGAVASRSPRRARASARRPSSPSRQHSQIGRPLTSAG